MKGEKEEHLVILFNSHICSIYISLSGLLVVERLSITFTSNGKREFVPRDQAFPFIVVYCSLFLNLHRN